MPPLFPLSITLTEALHPANTMDPTPKELWEQCRHIIRQNVSQAQYDALFAYTEFSAYAEGELVLDVPSQFIFDELEKDDYAALLNKTLTHVFGKSLRLSYRIPVVSKPRAEVKVRATQPPAVVNGHPVRPGNQAPDPLMAPAVSDLDSQLHSGYFFTNYYEGENNRLARTVGEAIAKQPAKTFNPFFLFGPSGCGKTHLVNAIGWRIKELHPELRVLYVSAHLFTVQYTDAVQQNKTNQLIAFYQTIDVLIIDDCQEFSGKEKTQNTFFHIFNHLHLNCKQIILTADRPPMKIDRLEERLLTRFKWGMQAEILPPTQALRYRILQGKVEHDGLKIPDKVLGYMAEHVNGTIRDLEGMLLSLITYSVVYDCAVSIDLVNRLMPRYIDHTKQQCVITVDDVRKKVCDYFHVKEEVINSQSRKQEVVYARQMAIYLASKYTDSNNVQIGRCIGGRNHATVIHSIKHMRNLLDVDEHVRQDLANLEAEMERK